MQRFLKAQNIINPMAIIVVAVLLFHILISWLAVFVLDFASSVPPSLSASLGGCSSSPPASTSSSALPAGPPGPTSPSRPSLASVSFSNSLFHQPSCSSWRFGASKVSC